jgi:hypothetical protein
MAKMVLTNSPVYLDLEAALAQSRVSRTGIGRALLKDLNF